MWTAAGPSHAALDIVERRAVVYVLFRVSFEVSIIIVVLVAGEIIVEYGARCALACMTLPRRPGRCGAACGRVRFSVV